LRPLDGWSRVRPLRRRPRTRRVADDEAAFADFYERVTIAEGLAEVDAVAAVREADRGWRAHMTYLERRFADRWRQQSGFRHVKSEERPESLEQALDRIKREQGERDAA